MIKVLCVWPRIRESPRSDQTVASLKYRIFSWRVGRTAERDSFTGGACCSDLLRETRCEWHVHALQSLFLFDPTALHNAAATPPLVAHTRPKLSPPCPQCRRRCGAVGLAAARADKMRKRASRETRERRRRPRKSSRKQSGWRRKRR